MPVQFRLALFALLLLMPVASLIAGELLPSLEVVSEVHCNVTLIGVPTTDRLA